MNIFADKDLFILVVIENGFNLKGQLFQGCL